MQDFKMNYKEKDRKRNAREKKKLKLSWHLLLIQWLRIKRSKSGLKIKKWWNTLKISLKSKRKKKREEEEQLNSKKNKWDNISLVKLMKKIKNKLMRNKSIQSKQRSGRKILELSLITRRKNNNILRTSIRNIRKFCLHKCKINKMQKTERKWILLSFYTTKP